MLLTDPALQYWSCVVAILATIAALTLWNKVQGPVVVRGLSRFGLLLGGYLTTAVAVLVSVNIAYGGLIVSVSDLFADVNPPMGRYGHHGMCGGGAGGGTGVEAGASPAARQHADVAVPQERRAGSDHADGAHPDGEHAGQGGPCAPVYSPSAVPTSTASAPASGQIDAAKQSHVKP